MQHATSTIEPRPNAKRAVEVVSMLGDSVVGVAHLEPASKPRSKRAAYILLASALILLAVSAGAFVHGVSVAASNELAALQWVQDGHLAHDFRPHQLAPVYDWAAFGGLFSGLLALAFGLAQWRAKGARSTFSVGTERDADLCTSDAPADSFPLVAHRGDTAVVTVTSAMQVELRANGQRYDADQLAALGLLGSSASVAGGREVIVPASGLLNVSLGQVRIGVRSVALEQSRLQAWMGRMDARMAKFFSGSAIAHMAILALFYSLPPSAHSLALDPDGGVARDRMISIKASEAAKSEPADSKRTPSSTDATNPGNRPMTSIRHQDEPTSRGPKDSGTRRPRSASEARRIAKETGILDVLGKDPRFLDSFTGPDISIPDSEIAAMVFEETGPGSKKFGGPNVGWKIQDGTVKSDDYRTPGWPDTGKEPGTGPGPGPGPGPDLEPRKHVAQGPKVDRKNVKVVGDLDKSIIRRHIQKKLTRIQYCYERELVSNPQISGTVTTEFMVNGQGRVIYANASGMDNQRLETCVADVLASVQFPTPSDNGTVQVKYPFHFRRAG